MGTDYSIDEATYANYIRSLAKMQGADDALREMTPQVRGVVRDAVMIARAERGDESVRSDIRGILSNPQAGAMRVWAARSMARAGTPDDIPFLRRIEESDPLTRVRYFDVGPVGSREVYPVREAARDAIQVIERRAGKAE